MSAAQALVLYHMQHETPRTIVIGDIHGCLEELQALLSLVSFRRGADRLVLLGDLMDRGPDPVGCVRLARQLGAESVLSNHDEKHLRYRRHEALRRMTGAENPIRSLGAVAVRQNAALSDDDVAWLGGLPLMIRLRDGMVAVHAGLEPERPLADQSAAVLRVTFVDKDGRMVRLPERDGVRPDRIYHWAQRWRGPESVVYGHAVHSLVDPRVDAFPGGRCVGLDTGCCFGGRLTALVLVPSEDASFAQVQARQAYATREQQVAVADSTTAPSPDAPATSLGHTSNLWTRE
jgi:bis(5'-nucleosyl)-tetraphosphatase (symmetrical)